MIRVVPVDPADEELLRAWHDVSVAATAYGRVDPPTPSLDDSRNAFLPNSSERLCGWLAYLDDQPAGSGFLGLTLRDNLELAYAAVAVLPELRRRGVGSALYDQLAERARADGRHSVLTNITAAPDGIESAPGAAFATARGLTLRNTMLRRQLKLPVPPEKLDEFEAKAAERASGYRLRTWVDACPEEYAEQYAHLRGLILVEAPWGDVDWEQQKWDVERLREEEMLAARKGNTIYTTVAVAPDGTLAGHTQIVVWKDHQGRASQSDTLVLGQHRGHRLGLALKVANLRAVQRAYPELNRIGTANAEQNAAMVKVNVDMGFEIVEVQQLWQGKLAD
jgi:GNAT superfamily N-acetyltransferase